MTLSYADTVRATAGLISYYRLDEAAGAGTLVDEKGGYDLSGGPMDQSPVTGSTGDGNDAGAIGNGTSTTNFTRSYGNLPLGSNPRSFEFLYKRDFGANNTLGTVFSYGKQITRQTFGIQLLTDSPTLAGAGRIRVYSWADDKTTSNIAGLYDGDWHHIVLTYANGASTVKVYVDGSFVATLTFGSTLNTVSSSFLPRAFMTYDTQVGTALEGGIDELAFYNVELDAATILAHFNALPNVTDPIPDFNGSPLTGTEPLTVNFTDMSDPQGGTITARLWDFGDGSTSSSTNPSHSYALAGTYDVSLTITVGGIDYTETKTAYVVVTSDVGYEPPPPGRAILEIKATPPGADRWDESNWDEAHWSSTTWQDITPYGIEVAILWGSNRPEFGILSTPDAASWAISFYDPARILDPANEDSPYFGDLQPFLPVRIRHNEKVIKQGYLESASHKYSDGTGYWRVMDIQAVLANAVVPSDTTLADTLFARAREAIAAAGLSLTVAPDPPGGDPALAPWASQERTAWAWISDAAQQVLWMPYVRADNTLGFRDYRAPLSRGRSITSANLEDLQSLTMHNGLFSIVGALELVSEGTDINRRELTPKPRYGAREYLRTDPTPDSGDWAQAVLDDRAVAALRWTPGKVVPFTASETAYFAGIEAIEQVAVDYPEQDILFDGIVVGGTIHVVGKKDDVALWDFQYFIAQIPLQPLTDDDDVSSYLTNDDDATDYLYPDV